MINWLKNLFKNETEKEVDRILKDISDSIESGLIYFPPPKPIFRKAKDMCDKPNPIDTPEGTYKPELPINCGLAYDLMVYEDRYCICEKILYRYCKTDKCFKHYLRDTDQWFSVYNFFILEGFDWWSTKFEAKSWRRKQFEKLINPSQERKEMEYEVNENCNKIFTVKEFDREKVYYNKISGLFYRKNSKTDCIEEYFPDMWKEINTPYNDLIKIYFNLAREKTPPRTLKLEDLNKLWANKHTGKVGRIFISNRGLINFVSGLGVQSVIFGEYRPDEFFYTYSEATQTDLDNLTKGN